MRNRILGFIQVFIAENGYPPTIEEIAAGVSLKSKNTVSYHLRNLEAEGKITRKHRSPRSIRVVGIGS